MIGHEVYGRWRTTLERTFMLCAIFVLAMLIVGQSLTLTWGPSEQLTMESRARVGSEIACNAVLLAMSLVALRRPERLTTRAGRWSAPMVALVAMVVAAGLEPDTGLTPGAATLLSQNSHMVLLLTMVALNPRGIAVLGGAAACLIYAVVRPLTSDVNLWWALDEMVLGAGGAVAALLIVTHLRAGAAAADRLAERARREAIAIRARANAEHARDNARRVIHDSVISALRAIELGLESWQIRKTAGEALIALSGTQSASSGQDLTGRLRSATPLRVEVDAEAWQAPPPPRIVDALAGAAAEALRNAERHGHATSAEVVLASTEASTEVTVTDRGHGLQDGWQPGFGVRESIMGRMQAIGGDAQIEPVEGGVRVSLWWPTRDPGPDMAEVLLPNRQALTGQLSILCGTIVAYAAIRYAGTPILLDLAVLFGALVLLGSATACVTSATRAIAAYPGAILTAFALGSCALMWWGLLVVGPGSLVWNRSWIVGACANPIGLLAIEVPARRIVPVLAAQALTVLAFAATDPTLAVTDPIGAVLAPVLAGGTGVLCGGILRRGAAVMRDEERRLAALAESEGWLTEAAQWREAHHSYLESEVVPFLERAADTGESDVVGAGLLSALCRDHLYLTHPIDSETAASIQCARRAGVSVTIRAGDHDPGTWPLLRGVLAVADPGHSVTVTQDEAPEGATHGRVVVIPPADVAVHDGLGGSSDGIRSVFPVPAPSRR